MEPSEAADREAIRDLVARYTLAGDRGRYDDLVALFADDGVLELPDGRVCRGRQAIRSFLTETAESLRAATRVPWLRHHLTTHDIRLGPPPTASGTVYFLVVTERGPDHWGRYRDDYVRSDGLWRFARRRVRLDGFAPGSWVASRRNP